MDSQQPSLNTIETEELATLLESDSKTVKLVCATWYYGADISVALQEFEEAHIPDSVHFSIIDIADKSTGLMATLPSKEDFTAEMRRLGIKKTDTIVIYEHKMIFAGPRASWMLRIYGAQDVRILNGCLTKWQNENRPIETGPHTDVNDNSSDGYDYEKNEDMYETTISTMRKVYTNSSKYEVHQKDLNFFILEEKKDEYAFIDSRIKENFDKGHPLGFDNLFFPILLSEDKSSFKPKDEIKRILLENNFDTKKKLVFSCGAGITACIVEAASKLAGATITSVYDGSFQEYSKHGDPDFSKDNWEDLYTS